jgi:hypothetical protein
MPPLYNQPAHLQGGFASLVDAQGTSLRDLVASQTRHFPVLADKQPVETLLLSLRKGRVLGAVDAMRGVDEMTTFPNAVGHARCSARRTCRIERAVLSTISVSSASVQL